MSKKKKKSGGGGGLRCHATHQPIPLGVGEVFGGSCIVPRDGYDAYVGLDYSMADAHRLAPWAEPRMLGGHFKIQDMGAPEDAEAFRRMVEWIAARAGDGWRVHVGCVGGHGRTGMVLAAVFAVHGEADPIAFVREHHCEKAVESRAQVDFLVEHYGAKPAKPTKAEYAKTRTYGKVPSWQHGSAYGSMPVPRASDGIGRVRIDPVRTTGNVWGV